MNMKSALRYGWETWRLTKLLIKKLKTFINKCLIKKDPEHPLARVHFK